MPSIRHRFLALALAVLTLTCAPVHSQAVQQEASPESVLVASQVLANASWREEAGRCPAAFLPAKKNVSVGSGDTCPAGRLDQCLRKCTAGSASDCYWLGHALQEREQQNAAIEALFQRSCKLGIVSGCTNRAASEFPGLPEQEAASCQAKTFQLGCRQDDAWACAMYARSLEGGLGIPRHIGLSLDMIAKTCRLDNDDACESSLKLRKFILSEKKPAQPASK